MCTKPTCLPLSPNPHPWAQDLPSPKGQCRHSTQKRRPHASAGSPCEPARPLLPSSTAAVPQPPLRAPPRGPPPAAAPRRHARQHQGGSERYCTSCSLGCVSGAWPGGSHVHSCDILGATSSLHLPTCAGATGGGGPPGSGASTSGGVPLLEQAAAPSLSDSRSVKLNIAGFELEGVSIAGQVGRRARAEAGRVPVTQ